MARRFGRIPLAYLYLAPAAVILLTFCVFPLGYALYVSLFDWGLVKGKFVGLSNYREALHSAEFWRALLVTVYYVIGTVPVTLILAFFVARLLFQKIRARGFYRTCYFLPYITSTVAAAVVWRWIFYHDERGLANWVLQSLGLGVQRWVLEPTGIFQLLARAVSVELPDWAGGPSLALVCVMIFSIWQSIGFDIVIFLAGLSSIPNEMHEAAELDGAGSWQMTRYITLPLLSPTIFFVVIISTIRAFRVFNQIYIMGHGERLRTTHNITMHIYSNSFDYFHFGYGAAVALILFLVILLLTIVQMRIAGAKVHY